MMRSRAWLLAACTLWPGAAAHAADAGLPPLTQPSVLSSRAADAVLTALARAGKRVVSVGERGIVLLSDDEGLHWRQSAHVPVSVTLTAVRFASATEGWATGHFGVILHTQDGGASWVLQMDGVRAAALVQADAASMPDGKLRQAALRNAAQLVADGPDKPFLDLALTTPDHLLAVGAYGLALQSDDGGASWRSAVSRFANPRGLHIYHLAQLGNAIFAVGEQGLFLAAREGGAFRPIAQQHRGTLFGIDAVNSNIVLAYGVGGALLRSVDAGVSWTELHAPVDEGLSCAAVLPGGRILVGTLGGQLLASHDGGASFAALPIRTAPVSAVAEVDDKSDAVLAIGLRGVARIALEPAS